MFQPRTLLVSSMLALLALPLAATAGEGVYVGGAFSQLQYEEDGFDEMNPKAIGVVIGSQLSRNLAVEGRLAFGSATDSVDTIAGEIEVDVDSLLGGYVKALAPLNDSFALYGMMGLTLLEMTATATGAGVSVSDNDSGISFGVGAQVMAGDKVRITVEWAKLITGDAYDLSGMTVGVAVNL